MQGHRHTKACMCRLCSSSGALGCLTLLVSARDMTSSTLRAEQACWLERRPSASALRGLLRELTRGAECWPSPRAPQIEWHEGTAESLPYPDRRFDAVVSQFGLMFFTERSQALREMIRVLRPGGKMSIAVWDSLENSEAYPVEVELLERLAGIAAANALRAPFVLGNKEALIALFEDSGVQSVGVATKVGTARFPSIRTMVEADLRGWLPVMGVLLEEEQIQSILEEAESALADYVTEEGQVVFNSPAHIVTGVAGAA